MSEKSKIVAYLSSGTFSASQALLFVMYPVLAERIGLSLAQIVFCFSAGSFLFLWGGPYWSMRSDSDGRGKILQWGQAGVVITLFVLSLLMSQTLALGTTASFILLLLSRLLYGAIGSGLVPVAQALMLLLLPMFAFMIIMICTKKWISSKASAARKPFRMTHIWPEKKAAQSIFILALLTTVFLGIFQSSLGAFIQDFLQVTAEQASQLMAKLLIAGACATVAVQFLLRSKLSNPWQGSLPLGALSLLLGLAFLLLAPGLTALYGAILFMSIGIALLTPSYTSAMSLHYTEEQGKAAGGLSAAHTLGYALGGVISSLGLTMNSHMPFYFAALVAFAILAILRPVYRGRIGLELARAG